MKNKKQLFSFKILHFPETASTNTFLRKLSDEGAKEGLVIRTDFQTAGRGKPGRPWISPRGKNLLFSLLLRPPVRANQAPILTQIACRSVVTLLEAKFNISASIKRPNDVLVNGKKICGVLTEMVTSGSGHVDSVIIGIGLNVNSPDSELPPMATSITQITGKMHSRGSLLKALLNQLRHDIKGLYDHPA
ncbi:MAG: biotin--[acetyl-CoA-carboxylase] ligase [Candidatus Omnitrophica bacterium]|nr:biotin--[acetyl-CoA-carboxylase] ligase [Candidatus Omnitrophota bacterium]